jgi:hypothetical protein
MDGTPNETEANLSVTGRVLSKFVDAVADDPHLAEVAARLRPVLLDGGNITEATLRQALFGATDS